MQGQFSSDDPTVPAVAAVATGRAIGLKASSELSAAVDGFSASHWGVQGSTENGIGVVARAEENGLAIYAVGDNREAINASSKSGAGVAAFSDSSHGIRGTGGEAGVYAHNSSDDVPGGNDAYLASRCCAGDFHGLVYVHGDLVVEQNLQVHTSLTKPGGRFRIDHPLDPERKYLSHSFVESPDMKNVYDGVAVLDSAGEAVVVLPPWFEALNDNFRYQLTCVGGFAEVYIADKIQNNRFKIAGGRRGLEVSWQLTGVRRDPWAVANRIPVEEDKPEEEQGTYLHPELHGQPLDRHVRRVRCPAMATPAGTA
jgi:hypothetical protein